MYKENTPDSIRQIVLNEAAVKLLGIQSSAVGKQVDYNGEITEIICVLSQNPVKSLKSE